MISGPYTVTKYSWQAHFSEHMVFSASDKNRYDASRKTSVVFSGNVITTFN